MSYETSPGVSSNPHMSAWKPICICSTLAAVIMACTDESQSPGEGDADADAANPDLPRLTPCPDGWRVAEPDVEEGVVTCDPWPDGDPVTPPELTPCPEGWREVAPADSGGVTTCDPWPEVGPTIMTPCPEGWREVADGEGGVVTCDPWPAGGRQDCMEHEAHFPGEPRCRRVGTPCTSDDWATDLPSDRTVLHVLAGAPTGGDGTREAPFDTVAAAVDASAEGTIVALGKGTYDEVLTLTRGVTLWGACVQETLLTSSATTSSSSSALATVTVEGPGAVLRNLRIGGERAGIWVHGDGSSSVELEGVVIARARVAGLVVNGESATGHDVVIRETRSRIAHLDFGRSVEATSDARVELSRVVLEANREYGVLAIDPGTSLHLTDAVVRGTRSRESDGQSGVGLFTGEGASVVIDRSIFERNLESNIFGHGAATTLVVDQVVLRDAQPREDDGLLGIGLLVSEGIQVEISRSTIERSSSVGVFATTLGTRLAMNHTVVRDTMNAQSDGSGGIGLFAFDGACIEVSGGTLERNRVIGAAVLGDGSWLSLEEVSLRGSSNRLAEEQQGIGLSVEEGARAEARRVVFDRNEIAGVRAAGPGASITLEDVVIRDSRGYAFENLMTPAISITGGSQVDMSRALIERNLGGGATVNGADTSLTMRDVLVRGIEDAAGSGEGGVGLGVWGGAHVDAERTVIDTTAILGVLVLGEETHVNLSDVAVLRTQARETDGSFGQGLSLLTGARVDLHRTLIADNREMGIRVSGVGTTLGLTDVVVRGTRGREHDGIFGRGLNVQDGALVEGSRVLFEENREVAILVANEGADTVLTNVYVRDTRSLESNGWYGYAFHVQGGARASLSRAVLSRNRMAGVSVRGAGSELFLEDVVVDRTLVADCAESGDCEGYGDGVLTVEGATLEATRFVLSRNARCGVVVHDSSVDLHHGEVFENTIGACLQATDFDVNQLLDHVVYRDNERRLDPNFDMPLPDSLDIDDFELGM